MSTESRDVVVGWTGSRGGFWSGSANADVVRQDLAREHGIVVSLRTVERAVTPLRQAFRAEAQATVRFETPPGKQLQIDFGETRVMIDGVGVRVYFFVATLGHSRRCFVRAFRHERQSAWFDGMEAAFRHFGGVPQEVLSDFVPGNKIALLCPTALCGQRTPGSNFTGRTSGARPHNRLQRVQPSEKGFVVLPD